MTSERTGPERRQLPRKLCALAIDVHPLGASYTMRCETTDFSVSGCYIKTLFVLSVDTNVDVKIYIGQITITAIGMVRTADPGLGNGIEFVKIDSESSGQLQAYLDGLSQNDVPPITIIR